MPIDWSKLYAGASISGANARPVVVNFRTQRTIRRRMGSDRVCVGVLPAGGTASQVTFAGQSFMRSDAAPGRSSV